MTASTTKRGGHASRPSEAANRYYVVKTIHRVSARLNDRLDALNSKYIALPLRTGKTLAADLKAAPRKTVANLMDDGKAQLADLSSGTRTKVTALSKDGQAFLTKASKAPRETLSGLMEEGVDLVEELRNQTRGTVEGFWVDLKIAKEGVENDTRRLLADAIDGGSKAWDHLPGRRRIENAVSKRMEALPAKLNLPSRKDIDNLVQQVKQLNAKVDAIGRKEAA